MFLVGIGASAGGLQALREFFSYKRATAGESYVIIHHHPRDYKTKLVDIMSSIVDIPMHLIEEGMRIQAEQIYISPSSHYVDIADGAFKLSLREEENKINDTINHFFNSMSLFAGSRGIGVIMSGTGTDGTAGAHEIEDRGGTVIVQNPLTAQFDGMPLTSIRYDHPDYILAPREMPTLIDSIVQGKEDKRMRKRHSLADFS